jgi:hypothetical protein
MFIYVRAVFPNHSISSQGPCSKGNQILSLSIMRAFLVESDIHSRTLTILDPETFRNWRELKIATRRASPALLGMKVSWRFNISPGLISL